MPSPNSTNGMVDTRALFGVLHGHTPSTATSSPPPHTTARSSSGANKTARGRGSVTWPSTPHLSTWPPGLPTRPAASSPAPHPTATYRSSNSRTATGYPRHSRHAVRASTASAGHQPTRLDRLLRRAGARRALRGDLLRVAVIARSSFGSSSRRAEPTRTTTFLRDTQTGCAMWPGHRLFFPSRISHQRARTRRCASGRPQIYVSTR